MSAEEVAQAGASAVSPDSDNEDVPGYKPPADKSIDDIINADQEDDSLNRSKASLGLESGAIVVFPDDPRQVIVQKLALVSEGQPDREIDLTQDLEEIKKKTFVLKEGVKFRIRIEFVVQREIVTGLKYVQRTTRKSVPVDKMVHMVGSYAPKAEAHQYLTPFEDAPSGMLGRGTYRVTSCFTDDYKNEHLKWEWSLEVKKDWEDGK